MTFKTDHINWRVNGNNRTKHDPGSIHPAPAPLAPIRKQSKLTEIWCIVMISHPTSLFGFFLGDFQFVTRIELLS
jgi:hypothetical protein